MNPYETLPPRAFWKLAVSEPAQGAVSQLWQPKYEIDPGQPVITAGSCFAQNIGRALKARKMNWLVSETAPKTLPRSLHAAHGYGLFSFRTGNIYSTALLRQWINWAFEVTPVSDEVWEEGGRFFDPFRPSVHPAGFDSADAVLASRRTTVKAVRDAVMQARLFVFTPGLTEVWINRHSRDIYPACPGTVRGSFNANDHVCLNFGFQSGRDALAGAIDVMRAHNPALKILLTVSPVPLTATMAGGHALAASTYTKSVLRAIAGELADQHPDIDYFPSYDLMAAAMLQPGYYNDNKRTITQAGIDIVMDHFFAGLGMGAAKGSVPVGDIVCEDEILAYYGKS
jgi:hypothetical protein